MKLTTKIQKGIKQLFQFIPVCKRAVIIYWRVDKWGLLLRISFMIMQVTASLAAVYFGSRAIQALTNWIQDPTIDKWTIFTPVIITSILGIIDRLAHAMLVYYRRTAWWLLNEYYSVEFVDKSSSRSIDQLDNKEMSNTLNKLNSKIDYAPQNFTSDIFDLIHSLLKLLGSLFILVNLAPILIFVVLLALLPAFITETLISRLSWNVWGEKGEAHKLFWQTKMKLIDPENMPEIKIFGNRLFLIKKVRNLLSGFNRKQRKTYNKFLIPILGSGIFEGTILLFIQLWLVFKILAQKGFGIGDYTFYSGIVIQFNSASGLVVSSLNNIYEDGLYMDDLYAFFDAKPSIISPPNAIKLPSNHIPKIEFKSVSFKYPNTKNLIFENFNMVINPGDKIAIIGENGVGKSTLIKLLLRFYDVTEGEILIDNINIKELQINDLYRHIGVLFQDFNQYPYSVRDNIALGRVKYFHDNERVLKASKLASADEFVQKYTKKYEQIMDPWFDDGIRPSGGQWQRIALARGFFRDAGILILDEPTSATDAKAEYEIFKNIERTQKDKTTIIVSHRFATVRNAEKIYVIDNGKIIEEGSHAKLMKDGGLYHEMFSKQAEGYR